MAMILLMEYSARHGKDHTAILRKAARGGFKTARKIGRQWFIDEDEELIDRRIKSGKYIGKERNKNEKS